MDAFIAALGDEIEDDDEETFDLFSTARPLHDLGMIDPRAAELTLTLAGHDFIVRQSPGALQSARAGGTTGAAVWRCSTRLAEWLAGGDNPLFAHSVLSSSPSSPSVALELGAGVSGLVASALSRRGVRVLATDQSYALRLLRANVETNASSSSSSRGRGRQAADAEVRVAALDWERDDAGSVVVAAGWGGGGVDVVFASDTVYNYALLRPLAQACREVCEVRERRRREGEEGLRATVCVVVQLLRQADVFGQWLEVLRPAFRVWRVPDALLMDGFRVSDGFVMHVLMLR